MIIQLNSITKRTVSQIRNAIKPETFDVVNETFDPLKGYGWAIYTPPKVYIKYIK